MGRAESGVQTKTQCWSFYLIAMPLLTSLTQGKHRLLSLPLQLMTSQRRHLRGPWGPLCRHSHSRPIWPWVVRLSPSLGGWEPTPWVKVLTVDTRKRLKKQRIFVRSSGFIWAWGNQPQRPSLKGYCGGEGSQPFYSSVHSLTTYVPNSYWAFPLQGTGRHSRGYGSRYFSLPWQPWGKDPPLTAVGGRMKCRSKYMVFSNRWCLPVCLTMEAVRQDTFQGGVSALRP